MADYIFDIDTQFLNNIKAAEQYIKKAAKESANVTQQLIKMTGGSKGYATQLQQIVSLFDKLGGVGKLDLSRGVIKLSSDTRTAVDQANLLAANMVKIRDAYKNMSTEQTFGAKNRGTHLRITDPDDLENVKKLKTAIGGITRTLNSARKKPLTIVERNSLLQQREIYKAAIKELNQTDEQRTKKVVAEINARISAINKEAKEAKKADINYKSSTPARAIKTADQAKSLEQLRQAYAALERVRDRINPNTQKGQKQIRDLNKAMNETSEKIARITGENKNLSNSFINIYSIAEGLIGKLSLVFGLTAIKNYVNNLVKVHGQFEMINKSLTILLHSSARAERVWGQITELAIKSPFQVSELATATKQMAAYRIEADKLYEKTKMLADISAGLGVEMSRLILAYGQVKAANFLRGTELRQFSEAGIDMLGQLAAYYTEIEDRAVSAANVFDRISKRMVLFEDVDAVLTRVTSQGGTFYKMQEEQAKTLTGQIRNLKDEIDLMFHEIGQSTHGILLSVVSGVRYLIKNWRTIIPLIFSAVTAFTLMKTVFMGYGLYLSIVNRKLAGYTTTTVGATLATRGFNAALASNPILVFITLLATVISGVMAYNVAANSMKEVNDETAESLNSVAKIFDEQAMEYERLTSKIITFSDEIGKLKKEQEGLEETDERYLQINEELSMAMSSRSSAISSLININSEYASSLDSIAVAANSVADAEARMKVVEAELRGLYSGKIAANEFDVDKLSKYLEKVLEGYATVLDASSDFSGGNSIGKIMPYVGGVTTYTVPSVERDRGEDVYQYMERVWEQRLKDWAEEKGQGTEAADFRSAWESAGALWEVSEGGKAYKLIKEMVESSATAYLKYIGETMEDVAINEDLRNTIYEKYEEILAKLDLDAASQDLLRQMLGTIFGFKWPDIDPGMLEWQKGYNAYRQNFIDKLEKQNKHFGDLAAEVSREIRSRHITVDQMKEELDAEIKRLEQRIADYEAGALYITPLEYADDKKKLEVAKYDRGFFGKDTNPTKKSTLYKDTLKAIDEIHKAFKNLEKDFDKGTAKTGAWEKYGASLDTALKKIGMTRDKFIEKFGDLTEEPSVTSALEWLAEQAKDLDEKFDIQQHLGNWTWEINLEVEKEEFSSAVKAIDEMFAGYTLSIELDKLHIPKDFAKDFFDVDPISLEDLRKKIYDEQGKFDGKDDALEFEKYIKKIDELETKAQQDRLKKYLEYSKAIVGDRSKILIDSFREIEDIENTFTLTNSLAANKGLINPGQKMWFDMEGHKISDLLRLSDADLTDKWGFTQDQIDKIREFNKELEAQLDLAIEASNKKTQADLNAMDWKALKESDTFMLAMQDLERVSDKALEKMISQITAYKSEWTDMPYTEVKEMIGYLNQLEDARLAYYKPDEAIEVARKEMGALGFTDTADAQTKMLDAEARITALNEELSVIEEIERLKSEGVNGEVLVSELRSRGITDEAEIARISSMTTEQLRDQSTILKDKRTDEQTTTSDAAKFLKLQTKILQKYKEKEDRIRDMKGVVDKVFDGWDAINTLFEEGSMSSEIAGLTKGISNSVFEALSLVQGFKAAQEGLDAGGTEAEMFGHKLNMAMSIVGWIVMAIQLIAKGLKFAFEQHDKVLQEQIDAQTEKVERLQREYEDLEKAIEKAYSAVDLGQLTREASENLESQIRTTEKMIALEQDKKKTDEDAIKGWQDNIREMRDSLEELREDTFNTLTDGIVDDVLSATRSFVDAWHDAYEETGDGMKDLEQTFLDMLKNILRQQASMTLIGPFVERFKKQLEQYVNADDVELTKNEAEMLRATWDEMAPQMNDALKTYFDAFKEILEPDYGELSGLEKGIQGMTEDQAEVLAAYWNSCRYLLANIDNTLVNLASSVLGNGNSENPIVTAIKHQTTVVEQIRDMVGSVIANGGGLSSHSLSYIRVNDA